MWPYGSRAICANRRRASPWSRWRPPGLAAHGSSITSSFEGRPSLASLAAASPYSRDLIVFACSRGGWVGQRQLRYFGLATAALLMFICSSGFAATPLDDVTSPAPRSISELTPAATIHVGKTADWVAVTADAVWVGSTGPYAVHRIDPATDKLIASVSLPGEPCAGLTVGSGSLWVPLCTTPPSLAKVNLGSHELESTFAVGPAAAEGGVAYGAGSVWLVVDNSGGLARINPANGTIL